MASGRVNGPRSGYEKPNFSTPSLSGKGSGAARTASESGCRLARQNGERIRVNMHGQSREHSMGVEIHSSFVKRHFRTRTRTISQNHVLKRCFFLPNCITKDCAWWRTLKVSRWTPANVKLLLSPRHSRRISRDGLKIEIQFHFLGYCRFR